ncbi:MAG: starch-binding protein [Prevotellaceae bacterium]|jgi:alpha-amylase|nr:starch-binding protein [Prevotellaceae bacterium]
MKKLLFLSLILVFSFTNAIAAITVKWRLADGVSVPQMYIYAWINNGGTVTELCGAWKGELVTANSDGWYSKTFTQTPTGFIFNNGSGTQTADLSSSSDICYSVKANFDVITLNCQTGQPQGGTDTLNPFNPGDPSSSLDDVMLQGFAWNSFSSTKWAQLTSQASEIGQYFDMIWLPPSSAAEGGGSSNMGYHPRAWSSQSSSWGSSSELVALINALHANNCRVIADIVVNHRATGTGWCGNFITDNYGSGYTTYQLTASHICKDDEASSRSECTLGTNNDYSGGTYAAARDLDHLQGYVRNAIKEYMKYLKNEFGYDGWRYDMTKGYNPIYAKEYSQANGGCYFSVSEYWDGDVNKLKNWVNAAETAVSTFDFANKYAINSWNGGTNYSALANGTKPKGLIQDNAMKQYAVTFVDNHDTHPPHENPQQYTGDVSKAYAYLLSNPGVPCIFWTHWVNKKQDIKNMITARKSVGLNANSDVQITNTNGYYESHSTGTNGELICRIGNFTENTPSDYNLACSGSGWTYYTKVTNSAAVSNTQENMLEIFCDNYELRIINYELKEGEKIEIYDITGKTILSFAILNSQFSINVSNLQSGIYFIKTGKYTGKFIKK